MSGKKNKAVTGGIGRKVNNPAFKIGGPDKENKEEEEKIEEEEEIKEESTPEEPVVVEEPPQKEEINLDIDYFIELENHKPKYLTHRQITVRLPMKLDDEINKLSKGKKGIKQELITRAIERELALIQKYKKKIK